MKDTCDVCGTVVKTFLEKEGDGEVVCPECGKGKMERVGDYWS
jgi:uncharacterized Zn finger protein (UPF0148 family)